MEKNKSFEYSCLFGGGAIRGAAYAGTMKAMEELGICPTTIAGSSVGSVFAGLLGVGYSAEEAKQVFLKFNFEIFRDVQFTFGPKFALSKGEVFLEWIRDLIESKYYGKDYKKGSHKAVTFSDLEKNIVIITTDISSFECKEFSKSTTPDFEIATAIRISCSMPGLMKPIEYNNRVLVDGDLQKSWPMWKLSKELMPDTERILEFRLEGDFEGNDMNAIEFLNSIYAFTTSMATDFIIDIYGEKDQFDYIVINTGDINIVDFNMSHEKRINLMEIGYSQTMEYFMKDLHLKKKRFQVIYSGLNYKLLKIKNLIKRNNIAQAKSVLGELFIDMCEYKEIIDEKFYGLIRDFKDLFIQNLRYPALFGKTTLSKECQVKKHLDEILFLLRDKLEEIENYLLTENE